MAAIIFIVPPENLVGYQLTNDGAGNVERLVMGLNGMLAGELNFVDEQTVDDGNVIEVVVLVDQWSDDGDVDSWGLELLDAVWVINAGDDVPSDAVDVGVDREIGMRIGCAWRV